MKRIEQTPEEIKNAATEIINQEVTSTTASPHILPTKYRFLIASLVQLRQHYGDRNHPLLKRAEQLSVAQPGSGCLRR